MIYIAFRMASVHLKNYFELIAFYLSNYGCYYFLSPLLMLNTKTLKHREQLVRTEAKIEGNLSCELVNHKSKTENFWEFC